MKKIWLWIKIFVALFVGIAFFMILYRNSGVMLAEWVDVENSKQLVEAKFNYFFGVKELTLTTILFGSFIVGAFFTLIISLLFSFPSFLNVYQLRSQVKKLERQLEETQQKSSI